MTDIQRQVNQLQETTTELLATVIALSSIIIESGICTQADLHREVKRLMEDAVENVARKMAEGN